MVQFFGGGLFEGTDGDRLRVNTAHHVRAPAGRPVEPMIRLTVSALTMLSSFPGLTRPAACAALTSSSLPAGKSTPRSACRS